MARSGSHRRLSVVAGIILALSVATSSGQSLFTDVTDSAGVGFEHLAVPDVAGMILGTGAAWSDFDRDGDLDLYVAQSWGANRLFRNDGNGSFTDVAHSLGAADSSGLGGGVAVADYNNDGWIDIFLANNSRDVLLKNLGGSGFMDVTLAAGFDPDENSRGASASWGDYDGDAYLDLYVANHMHMSGPFAEHSDRVYHNNGDGTFTDVSSLFLESDLSGFGFIASWTDFDNDGELDIFLVNDCPFSSEGWQPLKLLRNVGAEAAAAAAGWRFEDVSEQTGAASCINGMGLAIADFDRNGWLDYFQTNIGQTLLLSNDGGVFTDVTSDAGVGIAPAGSRNVWTWGTNFFDYDLDGWPDLFVAAGIVSNRPDLPPTPNYLFKNSGDATFDDVTDISGLADPGRTRTSIVGDYDQDGDLDLYIVNSGGKGLLFRNEADTDNHYLIVQTVGTISNRDGIGSRIEVVLPDGAVLIDEIRSGSSLGGGDDIRVHLGLGSAATVPRLTVRWPSGIVQTLTDVGVDQTIVVVEEGSVTATEEFVHANGETQGERFDVAYPNPFRFYTSFRLQRDVPGFVEIVDVTGRLVARLGYQSGPSVTVTWDGRRAGGQRVPPGIYLARITGEAVRPQTIVFLGR